MKSLCLIFAILFVTIYQYVEAIPITRLKRGVSDQKFAELQTLIALSKMRGKLVTVSNGLRKVDPNIIGRKRRSQSRLLDLLFNHSAEKDAGDLE